MDLVTLSPYHSDDQRSAFPSVGMKAYIRPPKEPDKASLPDEFVLALAKCPYAFMHMIHRHETE